MRTRCLEVIRGEYGRDMSYLRIGTAPFWRGANISTEFLVLSLLGFAFGSSCADDRRVRWERLSGDDTLSAGRCVAGVLALSSSISNCLWIRKGFRSLALGCTRALIVTIPVD